MIKFFNLIITSRLVIISIGMIAFIPAVLAQVSDKDISPEDIKIAIENINSNYYMPFDVANIGRVNNSLVNSYTSISGTNIYEIRQLFCQIQIL